MIDHLKTMAYAMTGFSGAMLMSALLLAIAFRMPVPEGMEPNQFGWCVGGVEGLVFLVWAIFPRMRAEFPRDTRFLIWFWLFVPGLYVLSLGHPYLAFWRDISDLASIVTFGRVTDLRPPIWTTGTMRVIEWTSIGLSASSIVYGWLKFQGFDRTVLVSVAIGHSLLILSVVYPKAVELMWFILAGFVISLTWGGPIGQSAQNILRNFLNYFGQRPASRGPTSIEVPEKGTDISRL